MCQAAEIKGHIQNHPEHHPWLANYLVVKRICTQPNFHELYLDLVKELEVSPFCQVGMARTKFIVCIPMCESKRGREGGHRACLCTVCAVEKRDLGNRGT